MDRINVLLTKEQDLRWAERKDANEKIEQLKAELAAERRESATNQKAGVDLANRIGAERDEARAEMERLRARAEAAEAEVLRLAEEVRGLVNVAVAVGRIEAALAEGVKTQPSGLALELAYEVKRLTKERDAAIAKNDEARRIMESYRPDWEELASRRAGTWIESKEIK